MFDYLKNIVPRIQQKGKKLDHIEVFIEKPWAQLNDKNEIVMEYEFFRDNRLMVSVNGNVSWGKWELTPSSQRLLMTHNSSTTLMHNGFIDNNVMILQKSGSVEPFVVFINQNVISGFNLNNYLQKVIDSNAVLTGGNEYIEKKINESSYHQDPKLLKDQIINSDNKKINQMILLIIAGILAFFIGFAIVRYILIQE